MKKLSALAFLPLLHLIVSNSAVAADKSTHSFMKVAPVVVSATRFEASIDTAPVNILIITADDIVRSGASTLTDVLRLQAGIGISNLFGISSSGSKIDLGGFGENKANNTLVLINGRRLNDMDSQGPNLAVIPLENIAQVEIVYGSATVLYGDNAVSGVVNIVTKNAFDGKKSSIKLQAGSFQTQRLSFNQHKIIANTALSIAFDAQQSNGYRDNNASKYLNLMVDISKENTDWIYGTRIYVNGETTELPGPLNEPAYNGNPTTANSEEETEEKRYTIEAFIKSDHMAAELALRNKHQEYSSPDSSGGLFTSDTNLKTLSFTPRANRQYGIHALVAGIDLYHSNFDTLSIYESPGFNSRNTRDINQDSYGIYINNSITISESITMNLGLRHHILDVKANDIGGNLKNKRNDSINSWDFSLSRKHKYGAINYIRIAKSFRSPVLDEMWNFTTGEFTIIKPQIGQHYEIGTRQTLKNNIHYDANLFRINLEDEIAFDLAAGGGFGANVNLDKTRHDGININLRMPLNNKSDIHAGYAYRKAVFRSGSFSGKTVPLVPANKFTVSGNYHLSKTQEFGLSAVHTGNRYFGNDDMNAGKQMSAYTRVDMNYKQRFNNWNGHLHIQNITNVKTADTGFYRGTDPNPYNYYPLPERAFYITFEGDI
jgi:iron complex outermembrane receptor protein